MGRGSAKAIGGDSVDEARPVVAPLGNDVRIGISALLSASPLHSRPLPPLGDVEVEVRPIADGLFIGILVLLPLVRMRLGYRLGVLVLPALPLGSVVGWRLGWWKSVPVWPVELAMPTAAWLQLSVYSPASS